MIDDKTFDAMLHSIRNDEVDVSPVDVQVEGRWQTVDFGAALARLVAERDDAIAQLNDADEGTDAATQTAERVVRELRQEFVDVIDRLEKQAAAREAALRKALRLVVEEMAAMDRCASTRLDERAAQALAHAQAALDGVKEKP